jgi:hypothetical protein
MEVSCDQIDGQWWIEVTIVLVSGGKSDGWRRSLVVGLKIKSWWSGDRSAMARVDQSKWQSNEMTILEPLNYFQRNVTKVKPILNDPQNLMG